MKINSLLPVHHVNNIVFQDVRNRKGLTATEPVMTQDEYIIDNNLVNAADLKQHRLACEARHMNPLRPKPFVWIGIFV